MSLFSPRPPRDAAPADTPSQEPSPTASRRSFLRNSIAIVPVAAVGTSLTGCSRAQQAVAPTVPGGEGGQGGNSAAAGPYTPQFFNSTEWAFINAAVARLIPADDVGPSGVEAGVPEFLDRQMESPYGHGALWYMQGPFVESAPQFGYQNKLPPRELYRVAIVALDAHCQDTQQGKRFAQLDPTQQDALLKSLEAGDLKLEGVPAQAFFTLLLQNTREGYLSDPIHGGNKGAAAWKMIGFPGARADYADWVGRREPYPLPPVSIAGPQG